MAPPEHPFPVHELEQRVLTRPVDFKDKSRKLGRDFDLQRDCVLLELVQYSCTTPEQQYAKAMASPDGKAQMECFPFVRLFRRCGKGEQTFHVETTAWEGQHAWRPLPTPLTNGPQKDESMTSTASQDGSMFANFESYFWSK